MEKRNQNLPLPTVRRMELWLASLPAVPGHVQHGTRPVIIVSNDLSNASSPVMSVVPCTTHLLRRIGTVYDWYDRLAIQHALAIQLGIDLCINLAA